MNCKRDENVDARLAQLLEQLGHNVLAIRDQNLRGIQDQVLYEHCIVEGRVLVWFRDFIRYPHKPQVCKDFLSVLGAGGACVGHLNRVVRSRLKLWVRRDIQEIIRIAFDRKIKAPSPVNACLPNTFTLIDNLGAQ